MKRRTILMGLGALTLLLLVGLAAAAMEEVPGEDMFEDEMPFKGRGSGGSGKIGERNHGRMMAERGMQGLFGKGDPDSDGIPNCEDPDDDADAINDTDDEYPHDHDNDGIPDRIDDDDDNDGIPDLEDDYYVGNCSEGNPNGTMHGKMMERLKVFMNNDLDSDGIPNCEDPDDDADAINDTDDEYPHDHDNDGIPDRIDDDDDNDGIPDSEDDDYVGNTPEMKDRREMRRNHRRGHGQGGQGGRKGKGGGC